MQGFGAWCNRNKAGMKTQEDYPATKNCTKQRLIED